MNNISFKKHFSGAYWGPEAELYCSVKAECIFSYLYSMCDSTSAVWKWPWWEYLQHGNRQMLGSRTFFFFPSKGDLPAHNLLNARYHPCLRRAYWQLAGKDKETFGFSSWKDHSGASLRAINTRMRLEVSSEQPPRTACGI